MGTDGLDLEDGRGIMAFGRDNEFRAWVLV